MKIRTLATLALLFVALAAHAQTDSAILYQPVTCIVPEELTVFQLNVRQQGDLRAYFRMVNTPDWCWVQGNNVGEVSTVVMPRFRTGQELEYFFVLLDGKRVIAKSPVVYRAQAADHCETLVARHSLNFVVDCSHEVSGAANAFLAAHAVQPPGPRPPHISPDEPVKQQ